MKQISFRKSLAIFSVIVLTAYTVIIACGDYYYGSDYNSSFTPEVYVNRSYTPLFYEPEELFYTISGVDDYNEQFQDMIVPEWSSYLKGKLTSDQIRFLLLNDEALPVIEDAYTRIQQKQAAVPGRPELVLTDEKIKGFIEFMHYAKIIEQSSTINPDSWNYDDVKRPGVSPKVRQAVKQHYESTNDAFLKNRYWFQTLKSYFYSIDKKELPAFFGQTQASAPKNALYYRGLGYVAGAWYSSKDYVQSNYAYSIVFDKCPQLRQAAAFFFHPQEEADFNAALALTKTPQEKAALWALFGYYADEYQAIEAIYKIDPASEHLGFLLTRLINREEAELNQLLIDSKEPLKSIVQKNRNEKLFTLVTHMAREGKTSQPYLWDIAAGFLNSLSGKHTEAEKFFTKAEKEGPASTLAKRQIRLLRLINTLYSIPVIDESVHARLMPELRWLYAQKDSEDSFRKQHAITWSKQYISHLYKTKSGNVMAELFQHDETFYQNTANLEQMKTFLLKPDKSAWEEFAASVYPLTLDDVYEYEAVMHAYGGNLDSAIASMGKSQEKEDMLLGNPFNGKIKDCHDCDHLAIQHVRYNKLTFLQKMKEMQSLVDQKKDVYNNSLLLGNAYYNITYFGNARAFYYGDIINQGENSIASYYQKFLFNCDRAKQYYTLALATAVNDEQRAKCEYMLAKCERNDFYSTEYHSKESNGYQEINVAFREWKGFKNLRDKYAHTKYYKDVINECGYFRKYTTGN